MKTGRIKVGSCMKSDKLSLNYDWWASWESGTLMCANDQVFWLYLGSHTAISHSLVITQSGANQDIEGWKHSIVCLCTFVDWFGFLRGVFATAASRCVRTLPPQQQALKLTARLLARCHQAEHTAVTTHLSGRQAEWKSDHRCDILIGEKKIQ